MTLDLARVRADFPLLSQPENGRRLVYLDNAATTQKPESVLAAIQDYYRTSNANVHRGAYTLAARATEAYESARAAVARFLNAWGPECVVFTRGTTEAINLVAGSYGRANVRAGDSVVVTAMDHHSNLVPWQLLCRDRGAALRMVEVSPDGRIDALDFARALALRPKLVAFPYVSNALGTINPAAELVRQAHAAGAVAVIDGAQSTPHLPVDLQALDIDFYGFSGHKMLGPMGSGALVAKPELLRAMPPYHGGGEMIARVWDDHSTWNEIPHKFEAGTPNVEGAVGLAAAIAYLERLGMEGVAEHEASLGREARARLAGIDGVQLY
jgi:cysteine desulfurase/selenocysteine lyase